MNSEPVLRFDPAIHQLLDGPDVERLREELQQGPDLVVYRHAVERSIVVAHLCGTALREYAILSRWPDVPVHEMVHLRKQFNPDPRFAAARRKELATLKDRTMEDQRKLGRETRRQWRAQAEAYQGRRRADHPLNAPPMPDD